MILLEGKTRNYTKEVIITVIQENIEDRYME